MFDYNNQATGLNFIYTGGPIITISDAQPEAETLALKNGKILVKIRYMDAPVFLDVASIINQYSIEGEIALGASWSNALDGDSRTVSGTGRYADRPTITYAPLSGERFSRSLMAPIPVASILSLLQSGQPMIINLRADPFEKGPHEADMGYLRWYADNMWLFVPVQSVIKEFLASIDDYPFQTGASLNAAGINYNWIYTPLKHFVRNKPMVNLRIGSITGHLFGPPGPAIAVRRESRRTSYPALPRACSSRLRQHPWRLGSEALRLLQRWG